MHRCLLVPELLDLVCRHLDAQTLLNLLQCCKALKPQVLDALYAYHEVPLSGVLSHGPAHILAKRHTPHRLQILKPFKTTEDWYSIETIARRVKRLDVSWEGFNSFAFKHLRRWSGYPNNMFSRLDSLAWRIEFGPAGWIHLARMILGHQLRTLILDNTPTLYPPIPLPGLAADDITAFMSAISATCPSISTFVHQKGRIISGGGLLRNFLELCSLVIGVDALFDAETLNAIRSLPLLRSLHLTSHLYWTSPIGNAVACSHKPFPSLREVKIESGNLAQFIAFLPWAQLSSLDFASTSIYELRHRTALSPTHLRQLRIEEYRYPPADMDEIIMVLPYTSLTSLEIINHTYEFCVDDDSLLLLVTALTSLEHLCLKARITDYRSYRLTSRAFIDVATHCPFIHEMDITVLLFPPPLPEFEISNTSLESIGLGVTRITRPLEIASFLKTLFPSLKRFKSDFPDLDETKELSELIEVGIPGGEDD
ncbi:hypothetical protein DL96DRAFT_1590789 [Flagelloscypha sp. PMI_526]|nr:hypothetical protein DL96DRAFT_1590789 [Flagelloscypha sp. PMI_526]